MKISIDNLTKRFGEVVALDGVDLEIGDGELFFLLGPSGCGKTTLLRCLAGFETPEEGRILFDDEDVVALPAHQRPTSMVFQGYALWPHLTVRQNVAFGLESQGVARGEREQRVTRALERVHIGDLAARRPNELSGGQQQRVALARTMVVEPGCMLLDEPLANLDAKLRRDMRSEIRCLCKESGHTAVYVTHDREEALSMADRLAVFRDGRILQVGTPREVYQAPSSLFVAGFIGETNFLSGRIADMSAGEVRVETSIGVLRARAAGHPGLTPGVDVTVSLRPEALRRGTAETNVFDSTVAEVVYLGETAEYTVETSAGDRLRLVELHPVDPASPGTALPVSVSPDDVVVLSV